MNIKEILARKNILIREAQALQILQLRNIEPARQWLRTRLPHRVALLPRQTILFVVGDVDRLKAELAALALLNPPMLTRL